MSPCSHASLSQRILRRGAFSLLSQLLSGPGVNNHKHESNGSSSHPWQHSAVSMCVSTLPSLFSVFSAQHLRVSQTSPLPATLTKKKEKPAPPPSLNLLLISSHLSPPKQLEPQQTRPRENMSDPPPPSAVYSGEEQRLGRVATTDSQEEWVGSGRAFTWDDGVDADRGVASQCEAKVLLPPVHTNDPEEQEVEKVRFCWQVRNVFSHDMFSWKCKVIG